jgi:hypothetical protein
MIFHFVFVIFTILVHHQYYDGPIPQATLQYLRENHRAQFNQLLEMKDNKGLTPLLTAALWQLVYNGILVAVWSIN